MSEVTRPPASPYFPALDAMRFLAFGRVFSLHTLGSVFDYKALGGFAPLIIGNAVFGPRGLVFFFVLSGFLITYLLERERDMTGGMNVWAFYIRRSLRIFPLYYAVLLIYFVVLPAIGAWTPGQQSPWHYFFFLANFDQLRHLPDAADLGLTITWVLSIQEQFYLLWPLVLLAAPRRALPWLIAALSVASFAFRYQHRASYVTTYLHSFAVVSDFGLGALAALVATRAPQALERLRSLPRWALALGYGLAAFAWLFGERAFGRGSAAERGLIGLGFAFIILEQAFGRAGLFSLGKWPWLVYWGRRSYGLYLLHPIAMMAMKYALGLNVGEHGRYLWLAWVVLSLALTCAMAAASYRFFEKPFLRLKDRFEPGPASAARATRPAG